MNIYIYETSKQLKQIIQKVKIYNLFIDIYDKKAYIITRVLKKAF